MTINSSLYLLHCLHSILNLVNSTLWAPDGHIGVVLVSILSREGEEGGGGKVTEEHALLCGMYYYEIHGLHKIGKPLLELF